MFACNGILFFYKSPLRGETFVTRKITRAISKIALRLQQDLFMGKLDSKRDWGYAKYYIVAMRLIPQQEVAEDYVIIGVTTKVRDFLSMAFDEIGFDISWLESDVE